MTQFVQDRFKPENPPPRVIGVSRIKRDAGTWVTLPAELGVAPVSEKEMSSKKAHAHNDIQTILLCVTVVQLIGCFFMTSLHVQALSSEYTISNTSVIASGHTTS